MRYVCTLLLIASCAGRGRSSAQVDSQVLEPDAAPPDAAPPPSFATVDGWGPVRWGMLQGDAFEALKSAGMDPKVDVHSTGTAFGTDAKGQFWEKDFSAITFVHEGQPGSVSLEGGVVTRVSFARNVRSAADVDAIVEELERQYGPPTHAYPTQPNGERAVWFNEKTALRVNPSQRSPDDWIVWISYESTSARGMP